MEVGWCDFLVCVPRTDVVGAVFLRGGGHGYDCTLNGSVYVVE
jgi:hypothetical protein